MDKTEGDCDDLAFFCILQCALLRANPNIFECVSDMAESQAEQFVTQPPAAILEGLGSQGKCKAENFTTYDELKITEGQTNPLVLACQKCRSKILQTNKAVLISREVFTYNVYINHIMLLTTAGISTQYYTEEIYRY